MRAAFSHFFASACQAGALRLGAGLIAFLAVAALWAAPAAAQEVTLEFGEDGSLSVRIVQLFLLITVLSLAPGIAMMVTCFPFIVTVLSILRQAIGLQQAPPNMMIVSLAMFLTYFVMEPVFTAAWTGGVQPLLDGGIDQSQAMELIIEPFRAFMTARVDPFAIETLLEAAPARRPEEGAETPLSVLVPAFMLSEIQRAFEIGFMIFLPFLVIDLVVASVLMAMGMMMVPPVVVSLPFKLAFFVMADGWALLAGALVIGYNG
ncbi:MAG: flagellar type III secretion system pore protein FliP [Rhodobacteraceae bacterium]|nr:flagellar type III secretion system pore protein FliP [Paracoccaceae bacterium]